MFKGTIFLDSPGKRERVGGRQEERENENNLAPYRADVLFLADSREVAAGKGTLNEHIGASSRNAYIKVRRKERKKKKNTFIEQEFLCRCSHRFAHFVFPILPSWLEPNRIVVQIRK